MASLQEVYYLLFNGLALQRLGDRKDVKLLLKFQMLFNVDSFLLFKNEITCHTSPLLSTAFIGYFSFTAILG